MARQTYGQYCGLAHALDIVGQRWALLIVRDLLVGPRRYTDLKQGLPGIPSNILSARLKELEDADVIARRALPRPSNAVVYELTDYGNALEDVVKSLGRWGARTLGEPDPDDAVTVDSMVMALRSTFHPDAARDVTLTYELRLGPIVLSARIDRGALEVVESAADQPDLVIETGPAVKALMAREITPEDAIAVGSVSVTGDPALLATFADVFSIP
ncbi:winged helix-turn-helix transcriptional regulator [Rhodococcus opacus]|uniref:winged helix-turn-helix transcriptional regulator n=1 Tax=Rhodococcus opacus TaxID=37919 RepID=UPI001B304E01|nr:winged helix-turn-helix transcriptional regulator [Rhodococcus opacus]